MGEAAIGRGSWRSLRCLGAVTVSVAPADTPRVVPIRLVLVEDHQALRRGLALLLAHQGCEVLGTAGDAEGGRALVASLAPSVAVVDVHLGADSGIELTREIVATNPDCRVVLYTGSEDPVLVGQGLDAGATGYALKAGDVGELLEAVRAAAAGERYVDPRLAAFVATVAAAPRQAPLSKREREIMDLLARGLTGEQVAEHLVLSAETVKTHVRNAMGKLEATTRVHAIALGVSSGQIAAPAR